MWLIKLFRKDIDEAKYAANIFFRNVAVQCTLNQNVSHVSC